MILEVSLLGCYYLVCLSYPKDLDWSKLSEESSKRWGKMVMRQCFHLSFGPPLYSVQFLLWLRVFWIFSSCRDDYSWYSVDEIFHSSLAWIVIAFYQQLDFTSPVKKGSFSGRLTPRGFCNGYLFLPWQGSWNSNQCSIWSELWVLRKRYSWWFTWADDVDCCFGSQPPS